MRTFKVALLGLCISSFIGINTVQGKNTAYGDLLRGQGKDSPIPSTCSGKENDIPIHTNEPVFVNKTQYGSRWEVGPPDMEPKIAMIHVYGSAYNMGYGYGSLMQKEVQALLPQAYQYMYDMINGTIGFLPKEIRQFIEHKGVRWALDLTINTTKPHTPSHYFDLMRGVADGANVNYTDLYRITMLPELIKASCSMFGVWGEATKNVNNGLLQLRSLDWTTSGPFQQYPLIINYHPSEGNGHNFTIFTWAGLVGAITGYSSANMGISEKVWINYPGIENIVGYPFHFLLQDILQFDIDTDQALSRIATANRTCSIFIGIGDLFNEEFKVVEYGWQDVNIYNVRNFPYYQNHDKRADMLFINKHTQPSHSPCMNDLMDQYYGSISAENTIRYITAGEQTGDMHIAIYDFENKYLYVSSASVACKNCTVTPAYDRPFSRLDMSKQWTMDL
eukprot:gb/GECG01011496.1/.p1 GENE.gb/GECG01011496.1/~~gb/GECG01011496.1/.p1  ORF type:complete len:448 (+),score=37.37 gb/GECG01011496.1/:1-1344(+)